MSQIGLFPRPWSCHQPLVEGYEPFINGVVERVSRSRRTGWRTTIFVDDCMMFTSHSGTKWEAEKRCSEMLEAYTKAHYKSK